MEGKFRGESVRVVRSLQLTRSSWHTHGQVQDAVIPWLPHPLKFCDMHCRPSRRGSRHTSIVWVGAQHVVERWASLSTHLLGLQVMRQAVAMSANSRRSFETAERGRRRSSFGGSNGERIPKFAGGGPNSMRGTQSKLPPPAGETPEALQNIDSGQARLEELGGHISSCINPNVTYAVWVEGGAV